MPLLIEHIDAIARQKGRDVLYVVFPECYPDMTKERVEPNQCKARQRFIAWLDQAGIAWYPCGHPVRDDDPLFLGYLGHIYIDLPFDTSNVEYQKLADFLETPDGKMKIEGAEFRYWPLEVAMENKHHDEPGYWEREAEKW